MSRPAVFLDRDGTLIEERHYPTRREDIVLVRGAGEALARLASAGMLRIVLTNQSAVARGLLGEEQLAELHADLADKLAVVGGGFDALYYCPHLPGGTAVGYAMDCACRKPRTGLLELALAEHDVDLARSCFIGDSVRDLFLDVEGVGARVLVTSGHPADDVRAADFVAPTIVEAVDWWLTRFRELEASRRSGRATASTSGTTASTGATPAGGGRPLRGDPQGT